MSKTGWFGVIRVTQGQNAGQTHAGLCHASSYYYYYYN